MDQFFSIREVKSTNAVKKKNPLYNTNHGCSSFSGAYVYAAKCTFLKALSFLHQQIVLYHQNPSSSCLQPQQKWTLRSLLNEPPGCQGVCVCVFRTEQMSCCYQAEDGEETRVAENERSLSGRVLGFCVWSPLPSPYQRYGLSQAYVPLRRACTDP